MTNPLVEAQLAEARTLLNSLETDTAWIKNEIQLRIGKLIVLPSWNRHVAEKCREIAEFKTGLEILPERIKRLKEYINILEQRGKEIKSDDGQ